MAVIRPLLLLLWKNLLLQIRRPIGTVIELLIPPVAVLFLIGLRFGLFTAVDKCFVTFDSDHLVPSSYFTPYPLTVYYTPNNTNTTILANRIQKKLPSFTTMVGVASEQDFLKLLYSGLDNRTYGCFKNGSAIVFNSLNESNIEYTIRLSNPDIPRLTTRAAPAFTTPGARINRNYYLTQGFLHLQNAIGQAIIEWKTNKSVDVPIDVRQFPYPSYRQDTFLTLISFMLPLLIVMSFIYTAAIFIKELVIEKETRIRESMKMMGLSQWVLWTTWFVKQFLFLLISVILMTILLKIGKVFPYSNGVLIFFFLLTFSLSLVAFGYLMSVWFNSSRVALVVGFLAWFLNYIPFLFISNSYDSLTLGSKLGLCVLSNTCVGLAIQVISGLEQQQVGVTFQNFASPVSVDDSFNLAIVCGMLVFDTVLYMLIAWYVDAVKPGDYGVPRPFYFPFLPSYWTGRPWNTTPLIAEATTLLGHDPSAHEEPPKGLVAGISIRNLRKVYNAWPKKPKVAVEDISLNMYKDQVTALLGHNGAGKTTTMSILTGLYTPTSGDAIINGHSILTGMDQVRRSLGICPQHNVLFDRLTVKEHLWFFMKLKGITDKKKVNEEVQAMIEDLLLVDKTDVPSSQLSGGMKRKLSVAIALIGGSQVVILDEPTSGMDPYARRATWDLLVKHKKGRTVLLTTHHMDEADLLGDRIAIMAEGRLRCSGSSLFLKSRYGIGYHMTMVKDASCDSRKVTGLVLRLVEGALLTTDVGAELSFILPSTSTHQFPAMFEEIEGHQKELGISSYGVSVTTMEEVFIKVGEGSELQPVLSPQAHEPHGHHSPPQTYNPAPPPYDGTAPPPHSPIPAPDLSLVVANVPDAGAMEQQTVVLKFDETTANADSTTLPGQVPRPSIIELTMPLVNGANAEPVVENEKMASRLPSFTLNTGLVLWFQQFYAILLKRFYNTIRFWGSLVTQLFLPLLLVILALLLTKTTTDRNTDSPLRTLTIPSSAVSGNRTFFWATLGGNAGINFSSVNTTSFGMTDFFDYTKNINDIINHVGNYSNVSQCCSYQHQLLDQFCANRMANELNATCASSTTFGYKSCLQCLGCCCARTNQLPSCTSSTPTSLYPTSVDDFCPTPPKLPLSPGSTPLYGPLQDKGAYVAEQLLNLATQQGSTVFFSRHQGGFVVSPRDPPFSVCSAAMPSQTCPAIQKVSTVLQNVGCGGEELPRSLALSLKNLSCVCSSNLSSPDFLASCLPYPFCSSSSIPTLSSCYAVDGVPSACLQRLSCLNGGCGSAQGSSRPMAATYPPQDNNVSLTVWYNNQPYHMSAAALNALHNILLQQRGAEGVTISVNNYPLPKDVNEEVTSATQTFLGFSVGITVVFGYSFLLASFVLFLVQERESKAKHLQFVSGVHVSSYWMATFLWDLISCLVPVILSVIIFAAFQATGYTGEGLAGVAMLLLFTCWATIPFVYLISFLFKNSLVAYGLIILLLFFSAIVLEVIFFLLNTLGYSNTAKILHYIFLLDPSYGLAIGLYDIYSNDAIRTACTKSNITELLCMLASYLLSFMGKQYNCREWSVQQLYRHANVFHVCQKQGIVYVNSTFEFSNPAIGHILLYLTLQGLLFFALTILIERKFLIPELKTLIAKLTNQGTEQNGGIIQVVPGPGSSTEDEDVVAERQRVLSGSVDQSAVLIKRLTKVYPRYLEGCSYRPAKPAVRGISLAIPNGECFGLLGVNGAGKTTTFGILTGDISMTDGTAVIAGYDIRTNLREVQQRIGYCPQFDALIDRLTGREHLALFARLRGIPEAHIKEVVDKQVQRLDLSKHATRLCGTYSGGNKRKLSTALALVGDPVIAFLDEPTTGLDPATRRYLWDVLVGVVQDGRCIVLTSHSMEECEALCTRLAIMVNGQFKCLGSIQHLKSRFGSGFTLQAKVKLLPPPPSDQDPLTRSASGRRSLRGSLRGRPKSPEAIPIDMSNVALLHAFIQETFSGVTLMEQHQGQVTYHLPAIGFSWSTVFKAMESNKERLGIVDYSISQTSLEQVFLGFAVEQEEDQAL